MPVSAVRIFQPYHDELSREFVDDGATGLDWTTNPFPDLREAAIYLHVRDRLGSIGEDYVGVFSPKFAVKAGLPLEDFVEFVVANPGYDAYFINPFPQLSYLSYNVWDQGEISHPGILNIARECFRKTEILPEEVLDSRNDLRSMAFCNFWVGTHSFFRYYTDLIEKLAMIEPGPTRLALFADTFHDLRAAPFFPFVAERVFSSLVVSTEKFDCLNYPFPPDQILHRSGPYAEFLRNDMEDIDRMDEAGRWTAGFRAKLAKQYQIVANIGLDQYASAGLPFDLEKWQGRSLPTLKRAIRRDSGA